MLIKEIDSQGMTELMYGIEQPLTEVLASMEYTGVKVDVEGVKAVRGNSYRRN